MKRLTWSGCVALLMLSACGEDSVKLDNLPDELDDAWCDWLVRCGVVAGKDDCFVFGPGDDFTDLVAGVDNGTIDYHGDRAADCLDSVSGDSCDPTDQANNSSCEDVFTGTVEDGGDCYIDEQCVSRACDPGVGCGEQCCLGSCVAATPDPELGEACGFIEDQFVECADGLYCAGGACAPLIVEGAPCDFSSQCAPGLVCFGLGADPETCQELPGEGEPCDGPNFFQDCNSVGLTCDSATGTCQRWLVEGEACEPQSDRCPWYYLTCDPETNTCQPLPDVGEACGEFGCGNGAYCDFETDVCAAVKPDGGSCASDRECASDFCDESFQCAGEEACF